LTSIKTIKLLRFSLLCLLVFMLSFSSNASVDFTKLKSLALQRYGLRTQSTISMLEETMVELQSASEQVKIKQINDFFNRHIQNFDDDINIWGQSDYWATPLEALGKNAGDCEDYSIAKYIFLKELNIPIDRLKLTYVRAQIGGPHSRIFQAHMILSYYAEPDAEPLILDNLIPDIRPASRRPDLSPIFSFNEDGLWVGPGTAPKTTATSHLSRWRDLLIRIKNDGID
jgi:predicted transglutaminase-like cysteine proteinase